MLYKITKFFVRRTALKKRKQLLLQVHNELMQTHKFYREVDMEDKCFLVGLHSNMTVEKKELTNIIVDYELTLALEDRDIMYDIFYRNHS